MSTFIVTVLKLFGSIISGGLLFQAFVANNHARPITKVTGIVASLLTLLMFMTDLKDILPNNQADTTEQLYWQSVEKHPSAKAYHNYLIEYPDGKFTAIAREQIAYYANLAAREDTVMETQMPSPAIRGDAVLNNVEGSADAEPLADDTKRLLDSPFSAISQNGITTKDQVGLTVNHLRKPVNFLEWQTVGRYQVADNLVKDTITGLMWMRCAIGQEWNGKGCRGQGIRYRWHEAMSVVQYFHFAGYRDWRIPSRRELKTLVSCSGGLVENLEVGRSVCRGSFSLPTIDHRVFPGTGADWFWSTSLEDGDDFTAWGVNFGDGYDGWDFKYSQNQLRLVRSGK